jgi:transcriptional antiterminator NusG
MEEIEEKKEEEKTEEVKEEIKPGQPMIFTVRTTANREDQVVDFLSANAEKKGLEVYSVIRPHGLRSYIFIETSSKLEAEQAVFEVPYARGVLPDPVPYHEIEHMIETTKKEVNIQKGDIAEIISGPFKREKAKITKVDKEKEEVVVELLESAVPIPITLKMDALKVIRRDEDEE